MNWIGVPDNIEDYEGFVYEITNLKNGKKYIGKKLYWSTRRLKPLKGKKRKRITKKESDWKDYYGSSSSLLEDIKAHGKSSFERRIIKSYTTKWDCSYYEAKLQFDRNVLFDDNYYNGIINCRLGVRKKVTR